MVSWCKAKALVWWRFDGSQRDLNACAQIPQAHCRVVASRGAQGVPRWHRDAAQSAERLLAAAGLLTLALVRRRRPRRGTSSRAEEVAMQLQEDFDAEMTDERAFGEMSERVEKETS